MARGTGTPSPGLAEILADPHGPTYREVNYWTTKGWLRPTITRIRKDGRPYQSWPLAEQRVAVKMARLVRAGLRPEAAETVARHPLGGPVVLGPGVIICLFAADNSMAARGITPNRVPSGVADLC